MTSPAFSIETMPKIIKNAENIIPTNTNAFIDFLFHRKYSRGTRRHRVFDYSVLNFYIGNFPQCIF